MAKYSQGTFVPKNPAKLFEVYLTIEASKSTPTLNKVVQPEMTQMHTCHICNREFDAVFNYSKHITNNHKTKIKPYYDTYLKCDGDGECEYCDSPTYFIGLAGYNKSCNRCKAQKARDLRKSLRGDPEKQKAFSEKVSANQTEIWKKRKESGEDRAIHDKAGKSLKALWTATDPQVRKDKFGWLNRLSPEDRQEWIDTVMLNTGSHKYWRTASDVDRKNAQRKRIATMTQVELELAISSKEDPENYQKYIEAVWYSTNISYHRFKYEIDPTGIRGPKWHLDHKFSIKAGFIHKVDPRIVGSRHNLRVIPALENITKGMRCSITLEELLEGSNGEI